MLHMIIGLQQELFDVITFNSVSDPKLDTFFLPKYTTNILQHEHLLYCPKHWKA